MGARSNCKRYSTLTGGGITVGVPDTYSNYCLGGWVILPRGGELKEGLNGWDGVGVGSGDGKECKATWNV